MEAWSSQGALTPIFIVAGPGHYRDSLVALLRTIPRADLILPEGDILIQGTPSSEADPGIVLVDLDSLQTLGVFRSGVADCLASIKVGWPGAKILLLVDNLQQAGLAQRLGADCVLPRSISAGEFLWAIRELNSDHRRMIRPQSAFPLPSFVDRLDSGLAGR